MNAESNKPNSPPKLFDVLPKSSEPIVNIFDRDRFDDHQQPRIIHKRQNRPNYNNNNFRIHNRNSNNMENKMKQVMPPPISHGIPIKKQFMFNRGDDAFAPSLYELQHRQPPPSQFNSPFDGPPPGLPFGMPPPRE